MSIFCTCSLFSYNFSLAACDQVFGWDYAERKLTLALERENVPNSKTRNKEEAAKLIEPILWKLLNITKRMLPVSKLITMKPQVTKTISGTIILLEGIYESICKACILQTMSCNSTSHEECIEDGYRLDSNTVPLIISLDLFHKWNAIHISFWS